jgi:hypothetical protein
MSRVLNALDGNLRGAADFVWIVLGVLVVLPRISPRRGLPVRFCRHANDVYRYDRFRP